MKKCSFSFLPLSRSSYCYWLTTSWCLYACACVCVISSGVGWQDDCFDLSITSHEQAQLAAVCVSVYCMCVLSCTCSTWMNGKWRSKTCHKHVWLKLLFSLTHYHVMLFKCWNSETEVSVNKCVIKAFKTLRWTDPFGRSLHGPQKPQKQPCFNQFIMSFY